MITERLQQQIKALSQVPSGIISEIDGYRQTVEDPNTLVPIQRTPISTHPKTSHQSATR